MAQVVKHFPSKQEALSSIPCTAKKKRKKRGDFFVCLFKTQEFVSGNKDNNIKAKKKAEK
jgi:hypothetical protein